MISILVPSKTDNLSINIVNSIGRFKNISITREMAGIFDLTSVSLISIHIETSFTVRFMLAIFFRILFALFFFSFKVEVWSPFLWTSWSRVQGSKAGEWNVKDKITYIHQWITGKHFKKTVLNGDKQISKLYDLQNFDS